MSGGNIKVVVRCRPLNTRELARGAKGLIRMEGQQTVLQPPEIVAGSSRATEKRTMTFSFDKSYWSAGPRDEPNYASQRTLYEDLGVELLDHSFEGFNTCIFAYGQTGSGKSYSMMGYGADKGIIPLTTSELFRRVEERSTKEANLSYTVEVSYIEIYNEKVRDLLNPKNKGNLRVREHPSLGPYVEDLSRLVVEDYGQMITLMDEGNKARTVASTNMNETSSRSHAVFTLILTQKRHDPQTNMTGEKVSKISLVDLAGSERQASTGATGTRLREGANINKSLTTLGIVIAALAQASAETKGRKKKDDFVPYRDSVLTWLLKESLGGNSKTAMIAAISPADYEETLSTLRYADAAKKIKTHAVVNEDPNAKLIRELKEELEILRSRVASSGGIDEAEFDPSIPPEKQIVTYKTKDGEIRKVTKLELQDQLEASEKLMEGLNLTWEQKMAKTQAIHVEREKALEELGISVDKGIVGVHAPQKHPSLVNLNEDPLMSECLVYQLKPGATIAGSPDGDTAHIRLSGSHILPEHCIFTNEDGVVSVEAMPDARTFVNGKRVPPKMPVKLLNGFRVILGDFHVFRYNDPAAVRAERQKMRESKSMDNFPSLDMTCSRPDSPARVGDGDLMDWSAARREVADIEKLGDQDLDRLFDDIIKVRTQRKRPDSRPDLAAELESRLMTTSPTEDSLDTYVNPWAPAQGTTMTSISINTPVLLESDRLEPAIANERTAPEPELEVSYDPKAEDAALEQQHMTKQLKTLAQEVKRMRSQAAAAKALEVVTFEPAAWTARELRLVRHAVDKWRTLRSYKIAEEILTLAVSVREANVIAREMKKLVSYNLLVVNGEAASSTSALDNLTGIVEFEDVSSPAGSAGGPCTLIKVIDYSAKSVYCWDLPRFQQQLSKMRHVRNLASKPEYSQHFRVDATFSDDPPPSLSFVGSARAPLRLLASQLSYTVTVPIMCSYTMEAIGSCRVNFKCSVPSSSGVATPESGDQPLLSPITPGSRLSFSLSVDAVKGLSSIDFAAIHAQTRLSSLVGPDIASEDTFTSALIDLAQSSVAHLSLKRSVTVNVTPGIISHLRDSYVSVDFFARVRPQYLERLERFDRSREASPPSATPSTPSHLAEDKPGMRRCETDFVGAEYHDILASVQILELSSNGDYLPAEVLDETFQLHQGVQRRLDIALTHSSGKSLPWLKLDHVSTSGLRAVGKAGDVTPVSKTAVELRLTTQGIEYRADGTSTLSGSGFWDTAAHHSSHLDKRTSSDQKILVQLTWLVDVDILDEPAVFHLDIPLRILGRDAKRSSIRSFFSSEKVYSSVTSIYSLDLAPPLARSASDLWRLDTAKKHVPGEENLEGWRPRSLSLLEDFARLKRTERGLADVQATKAVLDMLGEIDAVNVGEEGRVDLVRRCVELWKQEMDHRIIIDVKKASEEEEAAASKLRKLVPELAPRLVPKVTMQPRIERIIKSGVLYLLRDSQQNLWDKLYFVLRGPYIHVHPTLSEREIQVINLTQSNVIASPDVEMLLGRRHAFTIFTPTNSYILQASSPKELSEWISVISQSRY